MFLPAASGRAATCRAAQIGGTRRDADEDAVLGADVARGRDRVGELDVDDLVDHALVEDRGDEVRADALDLVGAGRALR